MRLLWCSAHLPLLCVHNCEMNLPTINCNRFVFTFNCFTSSRDIRKRQRTRINWFWGASIPLLDSEANYEQQQKKTWIEIHDLTIGFDLWFTWKNSHSNRRKTTAVRPDCQSAAECDYEIVGKVEMWNGILWWCEWFIYVCAKGNVWLSSNGQMGKSFIFVWKGKFQINVVEWIVRNGSHSSIFTKV